jgi:flagellar basal-body rod protein FlgB
VAYRVLTDVVEQEVPAMINAIFAQPTYVASKQMLDATAMRHQAIAANLANLETPGYRRVDLAPSFQSQLQNAIGNGDMNRAAALRPAVSVDTTAVVSAGDGNTVQLENELLQLNQNTLAHSFETQLITGSLLRLRLAITGRPA